MQKVWKRALALGFAAALVLGAGLVLAGCDEEGDPNENGNGGQTDAVGVQVTEAEWSALLDSVATAEEDGIYLLGQNNFKYEVKETESADSIDLAWTVVSAGNSMQIKLEGSSWSMLRYSDCYLQVNGEDSITVYTYDEEAQTWSKETMAFSTSNYLFMFLSLSSPVEGGMKMSEMMPYSGFTFDEESGTYTGTIDKTVTNEIMGYTSVTELDGTASVRFGEGNVQSMTVNFTTSVTVSGLAAASTTVTAEVLFTAGGQSVTIPAEALAAEESA